MKRSYIKPELEKFSFNLQDKLMDGSGSVGGDLGSDDGDFEIIGSGDIE